MSILGFLVWIPQPHRLMVLLYWSQRNLSDHRQKRTSRISRILLTVLVDLLVNMTIAPRYFQAVIVSSDIQNCTPNLGQYVPYATRSFVIHWHERNTCWLCTKDDCCIVTNVDIYSSQRVVSVLTCWHTGIYTNIYAHIVPVNSITNPSLMLIFQNIQVSRIINVINVSERFLILRLLRNIRGHVASKTVRFLVHSALPNSSPNGTRRNTKFNIWHLEGFSAPLVVRPLITEDHSAIMSEQSTPGKSKMLNHVNPVCRFVYQ